MNDDFIGQDAVVRAVGIEVLPIPELDGAIDAFPPDEGARVLDLIARECDAVTADSVLLAQVHQGPAPAGAHVEDAHAGTKLEKLGERIQFSLLRKRLMGLVGGIRIQNAFPDVARVRMPMAAR